MTQTTKHTEGAVEILCRHLAKIASNDVFTIGDFHASLETARTIDKDMDTLRELSARLDSALAMNATLAKRVKRLEEELELVCDQYEEIRKFHNMTPSKIIFAARAALAEKEGV